MPEKKIASANYPWSPEVRTWVSLLLFIHLFAVVVAVTSYTRPSGLQDQLHALFAPYLRTLHLAILPITYPFARFHLTHASPSDVDYTCEVEIPNGSDSSDVITLPELTLSPGVRFRRYPAMINAMGSLVEGEGSEDLGSILPRAIAGSILKQSGAERGTIRCRAHVPAAMELMGSGPKGREALENYRDVYEAQVFYTVGGIELLKKSTTLEVAPIEGKSQP